MKILVIGEEARVRKYIPDPALLEKHEFVYVPLGASDEEILNAGRDADILQTDAIARVSADVIRGMPNLKMIHSEGVAYNGVDVRAAQERGVYVCNNRGVNAGAVAEQTILLMLGLLRRVVPYDRSVREGRQMAVKMGCLKNGSLRELGALTVGIVGFGAIGHAVAKRLQPFGTKILYWTRSGEKKNPFGAEYRPLEEVLAESDLVTIHTAVTPETEHFADQTFFSAMKPGAYFINTARGEVVDEDALVEALRSGRLAGAGLDTMTGEPVGSDHPVLRAGPEVTERILFSPHIAGITGDVLYESYRMIWEDIACIEAGEPPVYQVPREA